MQGLALALLIKCSRRGTDSPSSAEMQEEPRVRAVLGLRQQGAAAAAGKVPAARRAGPLPFDCFRSCFYSK